MPKKIGELLEDASEVRGQWRIPGFLALTEEEEKYSSPEFLFLDSWWSLRIYPNREVDEIPGWIGIYLHRDDSIPSKTVIASFSIKNAYGGVENLQTLEKHTFESNVAWGFARFLEVSELRRRKGELAPADQLTVCYTLKSCDQHALEGSLSRRLLNVSRRWNDILTEHKRTDVVLKMDDGEIPAHRMVLEESSAVFRGMFGTDMKESRTGEVNIEEATVSTFRVALSFLYTGHPKGLVNENVCDVYRVAHKYEFEELRNFCAIFMRENFCADTVCRVISLAELHGDTPLKESAIEYFAENKSEILKREEWKTFKRDKPEISVEVLECILAGDV